MGKSQTGATPATVLLNRNAVAFSTHTYRHDPRAGEFGAEAATLLGVAPERIFKTLIVTVDETLACAVVPVAGRLNLKACAAALGGKHADLADPRAAARATGYIIGGISPLGQRAAARATGYIIGGISPLGQRAALRTVVDSSAADFATVFVSGGRRGLQVELAPADLVRLTGAVQADIARG